MGKCVALLLDVSVLCVSTLVSLGNEDREGDPGVVMTVLQRPYHERRAQFIACVQKPCVRVKCAVL